MENLGDYKFKWGLYEDECLDVIWVFDKRYLYRCLRELDEDDETYMAIKIFLESKENV